MNGVFDEHQINFEKYLLIVHDEQHLKYYTTQSIFY